MVVDQSRRAGIAGGDGHGNVGGGRTLRRGSCRGRAGRHLNRAVQGTAATAGPGRFGRRRRCCRSRARRGGDRQDRAAARSRLHHRAPGLLGAWRRNRGHAPVRRGSRPADAVPVSPRQPSLRAAPGAGGGSGAGRWPAAQPAGRMYRSAGSAGHGRGRAAARRHGGRPAVDRSGIAAADDLRCPQARHRARRHAVRGPGRARHAATRRAACPPFG